MMKRLILSTILTTMVFATALAQESQRLQTITSQSEVMGEERTIKVFLPKDYSEDKIYPVIYVTDAQSTNFHIAKNIVDAISYDPLYNIISPSILVGIVQNNRNAELDVFERKSGYQPDFCPGKYAAL